MSSTERKMAAIVAMEVTSYSEKMGRDEDTLKYSRAYREISETVIAKNRGRTFNIAGDAFMIESSYTVIDLNFVVYK